MSRRSTRRADRIVDEAAIRIERAARSDVFQISREVHGDLKLAEWHLNRGHKSLGLISLTETRGMFETYLQTHPDKNVVDIFRYANDHINQISRRKITAGLTGRLIAEATDEGFKLSAVVDDRSGKLREERENFVDLFRHFARDEGNFEPFIPDIRIGFVRQPTVDEHILRFTEGLLEESVELWTANTMPYVKDVRAAWELRHNRGTAGSGPAVPPDGL